MAEICSTNVAITAKNDDAMCMLMEKMIENIFAAWGERSFTKAELDMAKGDIQSMYNLLKKADDDRINGLCYFNPEPDRGAESGWIKKRCVAGCPIICIHMSLKWGASEQPVQFCNNLDNTLFGYSINVDRGRTSLSQHSLDDPDLDRMQKRLSEIAYYENRGLALGYEGFHNREIRKNKAGTENGYDWRVDEDGALVLSPMDSDSTVEFQCGNLPWKVFSKAITSFRCEGLIKVTGSCKELFDHCSKLNTCDFANFNTSNVMDMSNMFAGCKSLQSLDLSSFDTAKVKDMSGMFYGCRSLTSLDLTGFNTANTNVMSEMFYDCNSLQSLDLSSFNTPNVNNMSGMFYNCRSLESLDLSYFRTPNVASMKEMFYNCRSLQSLELPNFYTPKVKSMCGMFEGCCSLSSLDLSGFDTSNVTDMSDMFAGCKSLQSLDLSSFNTLKVMYMSGMFEGCKALKSLNVCNFNTSKVEHMGSMFKNCKSLKSLDLSSFCISRVKDKTDMFLGCKNLEEVAGLLIAEEAIV